MVSQKPLLHCASLLPEQELAVSVLTFEAQFLVPPPGGQYSVLGHMLSAMHTSPLATLFTQLLELLQY